MCAMGKKSTERMYGEEIGEMPFYFHGGNRIRERREREGGVLSGGRNGLSGPY